MSAQETLFLRPENGAPVELPRKGKLVLGSDGERAHVVIDGADGVHCAIGRLKGGGWAVQDLGSAAGTRIDGKPIQTAKLREGAVLQLGDVRLEVVSPAALDAPSKEPTQKATQKATQATTAASKPTKPRASNGPKTGGPPKTLGGYAIEGKLGSGAMGDVWLANQTSLDRKVALKLLKPKLAADARFVDRFRTEARAAARLNHPNIVTAFDVGEDAGHHFLSMEYMEGGSLQVELSRLGRLAWPDAMQAVSDAAAGLVYAESQGIVHRDIKPENLMRGEGGTVKIADLGLAVQVEQEGHAELGGKVFGTPHFLAPELLRGDAPTTKSDLYALGTTAYQLIAGRPPFDGADAKSIARKILSDEPPTLGAVVQGVPASVERVVHRLMAKDPAERPASAREALDELTAAAGGGAAGGGSKRVGVLVLGLAVVAGGAWAVFGGGGDKPSDPESPGTPAVPARASASGDSASADTASTDTASGDTASAGPGSQGPGAPNSGAPNPGATADGPGVDVPSGPDSPAVDGIAGQEPSPELTFETEAQDALAGIESEALGVDDRIARLRAHAEEFKGTDAARRASEAAEALLAADSAATEAESALSAARAQYIDVLRTATQTDDQTVAAALGALGRVEPPLPDLAGDKGILAARVEIANGLLERGAALLEAELSSADAAEEALDYGATGEALQRAVSLEVLPIADDLPPWLRTDPAPPALERVRFLLGQAEDRFAAWSTRSSEFEAERIRRERTGVAQAVGQRLETALASMDIAAAAERLRDAAERTRVAALADELRTAADHLSAADAEITALIAAWDEGGWKRVTLRDPRARDGRRVDVVGMAPKRALMVEGEEGTAPEPVAFELFGGHTDALSDLLESRTSNDRSRETEAALVELLAATASLEVARAAQPLLAADGRTFRFGPSDTAEALAPFEILREWRVNDADTLARMEPHRRAAEDLCRALEARSAGDLAAAAVYLDRLLDVRRSSYVVLLLSDGGRQ